MVINKSKTSKKEIQSSSDKNVGSESIVSSAGVVSGSSTSSVVTGGSQVIEFDIKSSQQAPIVEEKLSQKSSAASTVMKSSSSAKVSSSSSSQEQKFYSTSSSSSSKAIKSGHTERIQTQSDDDFLRGERITGDIDVNRVKNTSNLIGSVNLQNVSSDYGTQSDMNNLMTIEIETKGTRVGSSVNEFVTNTLSSSTSIAENRNDVIAVESGKSRETTSNEKSGDLNAVSNTSSNQGITSTSSATYEEFSSSSSTAQSSKIVDNKQTESSGTSKNVASSKMVKTSDGKNVAADSKTIFTSKVFDAKTKSWVVVEQSSVNETDIIMPAGGSEISIDGANASQQMNTMTIASAVDALNSLNMKDDSSLVSSDAKLTKSDIETSSKSTKEVLEKSLSSKKESSRDEKLVTTTSSETVQMYDSKSKTWKNVDVSSLERQARPSYVRYHSQSADGSWHTIYKRKLYDEFSKQWRIVDERVVSSDDTTAHLSGIPEMIDNATNITTTTYTTKVYDTKTGKWSIVEEKSYVDKDSVNVTQDLKREIERDQPDLANIITTTETTKVRKITQNIYSDNLQIFLIYLLKLLTIEKN